MTKYLDKAAEAWMDKGSRLKAFFDSGESSLDVQDFLEMLYNWTKAASAGLPLASKTLFHFLCAIEEHDRQSDIVEQVWPNLWKHLSLTGQAPSIGEALQDLKALVDVQAFKEGSRYVIHPGVAEAGLAELEHSFKAAVDEGMASFWEAVFFGAAKSKEMGSLVVLAGLSAATYLMRLGWWNDAAYTLEQAIQRDSSPATISNVLPVVRHLAEITKGTKDNLKSAGLLARVLINAGQWQEAESRLKSLISECVELREFKLASAAGTSLFNIFRNTGRAKEASELLEEMKGYSNKSGLGPWTKLLEEAKSLQILSMLGRYDEVLETVEALRQRMKSLPDQGEQDEASVPWNVKELILDTGQQAAMRSWDYEQALKLSAERLKSKKARGASELELARSAFGDYHPLLGLGRISKAEELLLYCKEVAQREEDIEMLGMVFLGLAELESKLGRIDHAIRFHEAALRGFLSTNKFSINE